MAFINKQSWDRIRSAVRKSEMVEAPYDGEVDQKQSQPFHGLVRVTSLIPNADGYCLGHVTAYTSTGTFVDRSDIPVFVRFDTGSVYQGRAENIATSGGETRTRYLVPHAYVPPVSATVAGIVDLTSGQVMGAGQKLFDSIRVGITGVGKAFFNGSDYTRDQLFCIGLSGLAPGGWGVGSHGFGVALEGPSTGTFGDPGAYFYINKDVNTTFFSEMRLYGATNYGSFLALVGGMNSNPANAGSGRNGSFGHVIYYNSTLLTGDLTAGSNVITGITAGQVPPIGTVISGAGITAGSAIFSATLTTMTLKFPWSGANANAGITATAVPLTGQYTLWGVNDTLQDGTVIVGGIVTKRGTSAAPIIVGTTPITGAISGNLLFNNAGMVGDVSLPDLLDSLGGLTTIF